MEESLTESCSAIGELSCCHFWGNKLPKELCQKLRLAIRSSSYEPHQCGLWGLIYLLYCRSFFLEAILGRINEMHGGISWEKNRIKTSSSIHNALGCQMNGTAKHMVNSLWFYVFDPRTNHQAQFSAFREIAFLESVEPLTAVTLTQQGSKFSIESFHNLWLQIPLCTLLMQQWLWARDTLSKVMP